MSKNKKAFLIIMDGWGINDDPKISAIKAANTPFIDSLYLQYPNATLRTFGEYVGLPDGQMGNSEVGHMNLGAGRVVWQDLLLFQKEIENGSFYRNQGLLDAFQYAKSHNKPVHFMGLVSDGGIHSHINHLKALIKMAEDNDVKQSYIHAFTDGRDTDPKSGLGFIQDIEKLIENMPVQIASVCGRYYAMDRDKRWERIQKAYQLLLHGKGEEYLSASHAVEEAYKKGQTDEFLEPISIRNIDDQPIGLIQSGDVVISFNFRTDRCREITQVLTQQDFPDFEMQVLPLYYLTMTIYDANFKGIHVAYGKDTVPMALGEVIEKANKTQLRAAETEKYPHVTFFFSGGRELPFSKEARILVNSPKVATYDLQPEMSAFELKNRVKEAIHQSQPDFICLNFANTDMVGHTGIFEAAMKAAETVDQCVNELVEVALQYDYQIIVTADHGNADYMVNPDGSPNTAHSKNLVPVFYINKEASGKIIDGKLADIAPTILTLLDIDVPKEMTGDIIISK
ncbi:MAG: 2,3-bisphosphoglycerate-independent phosphoglycerate mutase [Chitinophagales bacterium]|nr:2,3-bisphosphoglycerate-independent phosphoglycerate mutase [Chitinophagales bacterium]MCZ2394005.1 2,3-bisphosphoglycerate-independent phosphoglycerate mutase [Chitinophagales bacterium]